MPENRDAVDRTTIQPSPARRSWLLSRPWVLVAGACFGALLVAVGLVGIARLSTRAKLTRAPGFVLQDQNGRSTSLAQFRGKVVALTFIDPNCTQICPLTTRSMTDALQLLGPRAASHVQLLGIDANPNKIQVANVAAYTDAHRLQNRWRFLTGSLPQLKSVWSQYHVYVGTDDGDVEHQAVVILIDAEGNERDVISTPMSYQAVGDQASTIASGIAKLLPGLASASRIEASQGNAPALLKPTDTLNLDTLGPKRVSIAVGGGEPHLMLFFAGWLGPPSDLSKNLSALDAYAALARRRGWPLPVAVDVLTTEPSTADARQVLLPLAESVHTPIVQDETGRLADAYHVADLPWFVLNSPSGEILWRHQGWLSADVLAKQVAAALRAHARRTPETVSDNLSHQAPR